MKELYEIEVCQLRSQLTQAVSLLLGARLLLSPIANDERELAKIAQEVGFDLADLPRQEILRNARRLRRQAP